MKPVFYWIFVVLIFVDLASCHGTNVKKLQDDNFGGDPDFEAGVIDDLGASVNEAATEAPFLEYPAEEILVEIENNVDQGVDETGHEHGTTNQCWMQIDTKKYIKEMETLESTYAESLNKYQAAAESDKFDKEMLQSLLRYQGAAERELYKTNQRPTMIPAGYSLGGSGMLRLTDSILFFHRAKLRNNTNFKVDSLHNDLKRMSLKAHLTLNDLHIAGSYERALTGKNPSVLFYTPTFGILEILLKDVTYSMAARYRVLADRLQIEQIRSNLDIKDILLSYATKVNGTNLEMKVGRNNIDSFLVVLQNNLDKWLKDYFNDYLMYFGLTGQIKDTKLVEYDQHKTLFLNTFVDNVITNIVKKIETWGGNVVKIPNFSIIAVNGVVIKLLDGEVRGLQSMYRRSVATSGTGPADISHIDTMVGFSSLKVVYKYEATVSTSSPVLKGSLVLNCDELSALMQLTLPRDPATFDIEFIVKEHLRTESLTVEGPANRVVTNFRHLLEHHIMALMTNNLYDVIGKLRSITNCEPELVALSKGEKYNVNSNAENEVSSEHKELPHSNEVQHETQEPSVNPSSEKFNGNSNAENEGANEYKELPHSNEVQPETQEPSVNSSSEMHLTDHEERSNEVLPGPYDEGKNIDNADDADIALSPDSASHHVPSDLEANADDYVLRKSDSVELVMPPDSKIAPNKKMHLTYKEQVVLKQIDKRRAGKGNK